MLSSMSNRQLPQPTTSNKRQQRNTLAPPVKPDVAKASRNADVNLTIPRLAYKVAQAAIALGIDRGAVYDLLNTGRIRFQRLAGGTIIIPRSALDEYLNDDDA